MSFFWLPTRVAVATTLREAESAQWRLTTSKFQAEYSALLGVRRGRDGGWDTYGPYSPFLRLPTVLFSVVSRAGIAQPVRPSLSRVFFLVHGGPPLECEGSGRG